MRDLPTSLDTLLRDALAGHNLADHYDDILPFARLTFLLRVSPVDDLNSVPIGESRLGGTPDIPVGEQWAKHPDDNLLLDFIGQINLAQLPVVGQSLPGSGLLLVYSQQECGSENAHSIRFFSCPIDSLVRATIPDSGSFSDEDTDGPFGGLIITDFVPSISLPDGLDTFIDFEEDFYDAYSEVRDELLNDPSQKEPTSRLLGYPSWANGLSSSNDKWELLIEAESHFHGGTCYMNFWDAGSMQLLVQCSDISTCTFSKSQANIVSM